MVFLMLLPGFEAKDNIKYTQTSSLSPLFPSQRKMWASVLAVVLEEVCILYFCCVLHFISCRTISKGSTNQDGKLLQRVSGFKLRR